MKELTERQREVLDYIKRYRDTYSYSPTYREIAGHFDVSLQAIQNIIEYISKKGYLIHDKGKARTLKISIIQ